MDDLYYLLYSLKRKETQNYFSLKKKVIIIETVIHRELKRTKKLNKIYTMKKPG